jgi:CRISPR-associated endonuclease/helicase Cas3
MPELRTQDFADFFHALYHVPPFPWQVRLATQVAERGEWPDLLDLPTSAGKTAAIDIAVFHLALQADRGAHRQAPARIAFVVDRRLVVDDAFSRAKRIAAALRTASGGVLGTVAHRLRFLAGDADPLVARRLRGGIPREDDWARTPAQPTVLCSTIDQVGSRLLFRGYGVTDSMKPIHAGLIGADCLILVDEAHLAEPFRQTLEWVRTYRGDSWREIQRSHCSPWNVTILTATPGMGTTRRFELDDDDRNDKVLRGRLSAAKPARLVAARRLHQTRNQNQKEVSPEGVSEITLSDDGEIVEAVVAEVREVFERFRDRAGEHAAIGVVLNRVARARSVFTILRNALGDEADVLLMIGPSRAIEREQLVDQLEPIRSGSSVRALFRPLILVATQCLEVGVDIDFDGLVTEVAPLASLRQRFGRLNRTGRAIEPQAAIVAPASLPKDDAVYGPAIKATWQYLTAHASAEGKRSPMVDFGIDAIAGMIRDNPPGTDVWTESDDAPVLMPAHLDLLAQTSPIPAADPDIALYLHGPKRQPDSVTVVWRADLTAPVRPGGGSESVRRLLALMPPRASESIALPIWAVRRWLTDAAFGIGRGNVSRGRSVELADLPTRIDDEGTGLGEVNPVVFRWRGDDEQSRWISAREIRPGDTVVVPAEYGGVDMFGWHPDLRSSDGMPITATDVADIAAASHAGRRFVVRVAPGLVGAVSAERLADTIASAGNGQWQRRRDVILQLPIPDDLRESLRKLDAARRGRVQVYDDVYGTDAEDRPRGLVFVAPFGLGDAEPEDGAPSTEDDVAGSVGVELSLSVHAEDVAREVAGVARRIGLPADRVSDLELAATAHDLGKADMRWQRWIHGSDPLGPDPDDAQQVLAKSARPVPPRTWELAGLPPRWRHEALSVRLAIQLGLLERANDPELVLWLVGTHHGHGRPFFPHADPEDRIARAFPAVIGLSDVLPPGSGPQSLAFEWNGTDWAGLGARVRERYGVWELARMEAVLRLADHRASEGEARLALAGGVL